MGFFLFGKRKLKKDIRQENLVSKLKAYLDDKYDDGDIFNSYADACIMGAEPEGQTISMQIMEDRADFEAEPGAETSTPRKPQTLTAPGTPLTAPRPQVHASVASQGQQVHSARTQVAKRDKSDFFMMPAAAKSSKKDSLEDYISSKQTSFPDYLQRLINKKGLKNSDVYKAANLQKQYFSKIMNGQTKASKEKVFAIGFGLHLNLDEMTDLIKMAGYSFTNCSKLDVAVEYFIIHNEYNVVKIDMALYELGLPLLAG